MKTLLFKNITDADLSKGLMVAYPDTYGEYTLTGKIELTPLSKDGTAHYIINGCSFLADELKLIEVEPVKTWNELKEAVNTQKSFVPVSEDLYYDALGAVPPIYLSKGLWQMGECYSGDLYYTFGTKGDIYYDCLCNRNFALNNF